MKYSIKKVTIASKEEKPVQAERLRDCVQDGMSSEVRVDLCAS